MKCTGIREVQSRLGAGIREWCCVACLTEFTAIEFNEEGKGVLPEHEVLFLRASVFPYLPKDPLPRMVPILSSFMPTDETPLLALMRLKNRKQQINFSKINLPQPKLAPVYTPIPKPRKRPIDED